jgi:thioredoxin-related protein
MTHSAIVIPQHIEIIEHTSNQGTNPDRLNVVFVHVGEEEMLAMRYGIRSIPVQVFFDSEGKEVFRHVGFFPEKEVITQLNKIGVQ